LRPMPLRRRAVAASCERRAAALPVASKRRARRRLTLLRAEETETDEAETEEAEAVDAELMEEEDDDDSEAEEAEEDPHADIKAEIAALEATLKEKRLALSRANGAAAEASEAGYYRIVADVSTYKKNAEKQQEQVAEVAKADAFRAFDRAILAFEAARAELPPADEDEEKVHNDFKLISDGLLDQFKLMGLEEYAATAGDNYEPWRHDMVDSKPGDGAEATVADAASPGYRLKSTGAVIRKAQCVVSLAAEKEEEEEEEEESEDDEDASDEDAGDSQEAS